ncbi:hypothetical protein H4582DRAFT_2052903 [Lactarius indigo]|nr:hypothetical protein H4582DRAFT_2052903 [Lactarius indigo]
MPSIGGSTTASPQAPEEPTPALMDDSWAPPLKPTVKRSATLEVPEQSVVGCRFRGTEFRREFQGKLCGGNQDTPRLYHSNLNKNACDSLSHNVQVVASSTTEAKPGHF